MRVLVLHGPNLNLLGQREPEIYGERTLDEVREAMGVVARELDVDLVDEVSQGEATLVDLIQGASAQGFAGAVINAGAFTHTSVALRDAPFEQPPCPRVFPASQSAFGPGDRGRQWSGGAQLCAGLAGARVGSESAIGVASGAVG
jgi:hypothetical protein